MSSIRSFKLFTPLQSACILLLVFSGVVGCKPASPTQPSAKVSLTDSGKLHAPLAEAVEAEIVAFCGDCHAMPDPESFPKNAWEAEVSRGYDFFYAAGESSLKIPVFADTLQYFVSRAPERLTLTAPDSVDSQWLNHFEKTSVAINGLTSCAVSFIDVVNLGAPLDRGILFSEMSAGGVYFSRLNATGQAEPPLLLANVGHPAAIRVCDWDQDGHMDLMVADLGSFLPEDHHRGRVVWLRQREDTLGSFDAITLDDSVGRVASVEVADLDSDGNDDLLVAEFGWQSTGSIFWLQRGPTEHPEELTKHVIDDRAGTIHVPPVDINGDGKIDFIALISQHHERIEAMINDGAGNFHSELIYAAPEPAFGSSGIELVDMNDDGRIDVLYTNGDAFDSLILKPSHGVRWLVNEGKFPFTVQSVGQLPGAHRALSGDVDGDGQNDIAAAAFFSRDVFATQGLKRTEGLVVWTAASTADGVNEPKYSKHVLSVGDCTHAAMCLADLDRDGRDELIVGEFRETDANIGPAFTVWSYR